MSEVPLYAPRLCLSNGRRKSDSVRTFLANEELASDHELQRRGGLEGSEGL